MGVRSAELYFENVNLRRKIQWLEEQIKVADFQIKQLTQMRELDDSLFAMLLKQRREEVPNSVSYSDESTLNKVYMALAGKGEMSFPEALAAVNRLQNAGILFREEAAKEEKPKVTRAAKAVVTGDSEPTPAPRVNPTVETPPVA